MIQPWAPSLAQVADYVTSRTVDMATPGSDTPLGTFTSGTWPTDIQVTRLIDASCLWVMTATSAIDPTLMDQAANTVALRTAALIELSYPIRNASSSSSTIDPVATALLAAADAARVDLVLKQQFITGTNPTPVGSALPVYSFPDPQWFGDRNL